MKPLKLEFSGLNSYRDRQTIDFELLGRGGLFGIFGPTGGGKSSILDAITLALYGKVDRAENNTRGIINQKEKTADISFTFVLGGHQYTVQRLYQRLPSDPGSARAKSARLVRDDDSVLADKPEAVTDEVERILGLTAGEFCRAVVLPQGKFDEFLTLTGRDRAEMLGHIFNLDRFGEPLSKAAKERRERYERELEGLERVRAELGDCSDEAIAQAEAGAEAKVLELRETEGRHETAKAKLDEVTRLKNLHDQLVAANRRKAGLDTQKNGMEKDAARLEAARRVEPLRNPIGAVKRLLRSQEETGMKLSATRGNLEKAQATWNIAGEAARAAAEALERDEPALVARRTRLDEAVGLKKELDGFLTREKRAASDLSSLEQDVLQGKGTAESLEGEHARLSSEVKALASKQGSLAIDPVTRVRVEEATTKLAAVQAAEREVVSSQSDLKKKSALTEEAYAKAVAVLQQLPPAAASRYSFDGAGNLLTTKVAAPAPDDIKTADDFVLLVDNEIGYGNRILQVAADLARQALVSNQAAVLAEALADGEPCPVCGSEHHPRVAVGDTERLSRAEAAQKALESCVRGLQVFRSKLQAQASAWESQKSIEADATEKLKRREAEARNAWEAFLAAAREALGDTYSEETARAAMADAKSSLAAKDRDYDTTSRGLSAAQSRESEARKLLEDTRTGLRDLEKKRDTTAFDLKSVRDHIAEHQAKLQEKTGGEDPEKAIAVTDGEMKGLRDRARKAKELEESERQRVQELAREEAGLKANLSQVTSELAEQNATVSRGLAEAGYGSREAAEEAMLPQESIRDLDARITKYRQDCAEVEGQVRQLQIQMGSREFSEQEFTDLSAQEKDLSAVAKRLREESAVARENLRKMRGNRARCDELDAQRAVAERKRSVADRLARLVQGRALVKFLSEEHLRDMAADASVRLGSLTGQRYALEIVDESDFVIRDDFNGGERRPVRSLSGGETFLTSLSLALALSSKVQLRGQYPLGFFFLDEGFGTLDDEKLDAVMGSLDRLHDKDRIVGVISHVKALRDRMPYYLEITPSREDGAGSQAVLRQG